MVAIHLAYLLTHASQQRLEKHFGGDLRYGNFIMKEITHKVWERRDAEPAFNAEVLAIQNKIFALAEKQAA